LKEGFPCEAFTVIVRPTFLTVFLARSLFKACDKAHILEVL